MIDSTLIVRKINLISQDFTDIVELSRKRLQEFLASRVDGALAERYLERMIGRMIDINYHLITESGFPPPTDYYQSFLQLERLGILSHDLAQRIAACAGLRNRIVQEYDEIDPAKIHEALQTATRDVPQYLARVHAHIDGLPR
ncbi:MAG: DUF86 domain-containing protein [Zetaproteobacteria bacterium]|nr:MAG: DUF86 domain-containing protein [Zetaproteobacteria bacterium]